MKSTTFALGALMASSVAIAQPHRHNHHMAKHHKRNQEVVWVTDYEYVTEIVPVTTTIWVPEGFVPPPEATPTPSPSPSSSPAPAQSTPNQFFENTKPTYPAAPPANTPVAPPPAAPLANTPVAPPPPPPPSTPSPSPSPTPIPQPEPQHEPAPAPAPAPEPIPTYVAPVVETPQPVAPVVVETPTPSPIPGYPTPAPAAPVAAAPEVAQAKAQPSSSGGVCSSGSPCSGDITYYEAGLGACGETTDGSVEKVIALPVGMMGAQSNGNPYCGMTVTIKKGSKTITATVVDKCMGCKGNSIDLSNAAFSELAEFDVGRTTAEWWFN